MRATALLSPLTEDGVGVLVVAAGALLEALS